MVTLTTELQVDPVVLEPLGVQPAAEPDRAEQLHGGGLEHPRPLPRLAVRAAAVLHDDRVHARQGEEVRQEQAGRPGADDPDLSTLPDGHGGFHPLRTL